MRNGNGRQVHINSLFQKLGPRLTVFNRIYHMLDKRSLLAYFDGLVLPHLDYADVFWGDLPKSPCKEDCKLKAEVISAEILSQSRSKVSVRFGFSLVKM